MCFFDIALICIVICIIKESIRCGNNQIYKSDIFRDRLNESNLKILSFYLNFKKSTSNNYFIIYYKMSEELLKLESDDQHLISSAQNLIKTLSSEGINYSSIINTLDNALNKPIDIAISMLFDNSDNLSYQNQIQEIKIQPFRRLYEEIINYKKNAPLVTKKQPENIVNVVPVASQDQEKKIKSIKQSIFIPAKQSKSPRVKSLLDSIDINSSEISNEKIKELISILIQEGENTTQSKMVNLLSDVQKAANDKEEVDKSISIEKSERLIIRTVQTLKEKVNELTEKSIKTNSMQLQLIKTYQAQIEDLRVALQFKNETLAFEDEIKKHFENIENSLNSSKYDELFENYKEAFKKIEQVTKSKNEILIRNGKIEAQNVLLQQKVNDLIDENSKLKQKVQNLSSKSPKSPKSP